MLDETHQVSMKKERGGWTKRANCSFANMLYDNIYRICMYIWIEQVVQTRVARSLSFKCFDLLEINFLLFFVMDIILCTRIGNEKYTRYTTCRYIIVENNLDRFQRVKSLSSYRVIFSIKKRERLIENRNLLRNKINLNRLI